MPRGIDDRGHYDGQIGQLLGCKEQKIENGGVARRGQMGSVLKKTRDFMSLGC